MMRQSFFILQICGLWRPSKWPDNSMKIILYKSYTIFLSSLIISVMIFELVYFARAIDDLKAFADSSFMILPMISMFIKAMNVLNRRDRIVDLTWTLRNDVCESKDKEEKIIQGKFDDIVRSNTLWYGVLTESTVVMIYTVSVLQDIPRKTFPFTIWLPWDSTSGAGYWIPYIHQIIAHGAGATINIACDSLVVGLMIQTCAQLNILKKRFTNMPSSIENAIASSRDVAISRTEIKNLEEKALARCVKHHLMIIEISKKINTLFEEIIFVQYSISALVFCVSVYQLSTLKLFSAEFTSIILYLSCMSIQVFLLCYYGTEIMHESANVCNSIYDMDWNMLSINTKKNLLTIMIRTLRPIKYTSGRLISLNLDSFNSLIKLSYSAYNLLQQSSQ